MNSSPGATSCASQILSSSVRGRQIGVEGHGVALAQLVCDAVAEEGDGPAGDDDRLPRPRLVHRRVAGGARARAGLERVLGDLGALAGQRRREDLEGVAVAALAAAVLAPDDRDRPLLVEAQQLRQPQLEAAGDPGGGLQRRARLAALDLAEHWRRHAGAFGEVAQRQVHRLAKRADARAQRRRRRFGGSQSHQTLVR
jgi:hypothetical protein